MRATTAAQGTTASERVIEAVADRAGIDPLELEPPLYSAIDPDKLDALVSGAQRRGRSTVVVSFEYQGYDVTVDADGSVTLGE